MDEAQLKGMYDDFARNKVDINLDALDLVAVALGDYVRENCPHLGPYIMPNRVVALAAVRLVQAWEQAEIERP